MAAASAYSDISQDMIELERDEKKRGPGGTRSWLDKYDRSCNIDTPNEEIIPGRKKLWKVGTYIIIPWHHETQNEFLRKYIPDIIGTLKSWQKNQSAMLARKIHQKLRTFSVEFCGCSYNFDYISEDRIKQYLDEEHNWDEIEIEPNVAQKRVEPDPETDSDPEMDIIRSKYTIQDDLLRLVKVVQKRGDPDPEMEELLKALESSVEVKNSFWSNRSSKFYRSSRYQAGPLLLLLRESLLSHRWKDVFTVLQQVLQFRFDSRHIFTKVAYEMILNSGEDNSYIVEELGSMLNQMRDVQEKVIFLELILYLLHLGKGKQIALLNIPVRKRQHNLSAKKAQFSRSMDTLCHGYVAYAKYTEFERRRQDLEKSETLGDNFPSLDDLLSDVTTGRQQTLLDAQKATSQLEQFLEKAGVGCWDIFVTKLLEIYYWMGETDKALAVLKAYEALNPDNANVYRYLYEHHQRLSATDEAIAALKKFCDAIPSDELGLVLYKEQVAKGAPHSETIFILFDLLDYGCWQNVLEPWKLLAGQLTSLKNEGSSDECIKVCWAIRQSWWPSYHFTNHKIRLDEKVEGLLEAKITVASILLGEDCSYSRKARKKLTEQQTSEGE